jgi:hypothetical protein
MSGLLPIDLGAMNLPQWMQAIGSIAAVVVAIWLARNSRRRRSRDELLEEGKFLLFIQERIERVLLQSAEIQDRHQAIYDEFARDVENFPYEASNKIVWDYRHGVVPDLRAIAELPLQSWPNPELYIEFKHGYWHIGRLFDDLDQCCEQKSPPDDVARYLRDENIFGIIQDIAFRHHMDFDRFLATCRDYTAWCKRHGVTSDEILAVE